MRKRKIIQSLALGLSVGVTSVWNLIPMQTEAETNEEITMQNLIVTPDGRCDAIQNPKRQEQVDAWDGSYLVFGAYPQNADGSKKPIRWRVLDTDSDSNADGTKDSYLLLSDEILDCIPFQENMEAENTWQNSQIRQWLNKDFLAAFSENEQQALAKTTKESDGSIEYLSDSAVHDDTFFLLSAQEAQKKEYGFWDAAGVEEANKSHILQATEYAQNQGVAQTDGYGDWWLRSIGSEGKYLSGIIDHEGWLMDDTINDDAAGVAPAMNLKTKSIAYILAEGVKKGNFAAVGEADKDADTWKVTLKGSDNDLQAVAEKNGEQQAVTIPQQENYTLHISHKPAQTVLTGATQVSAMLQNKNGEVLYYGKIDTKTGEENSELLVPKELEPGNYQLYVFAEQIAEGCDSVSDFGQPISVTITEKQAQIEPSKQNPTIPSEVHPSTSGAGGSEGVSVPSRGDASKPGQSGASEPSQGSSDGPSKASGKPSQGGSVSEPSKAPDKPSQGSAGEPSKAPDKPSQDRSSEPSKAPDKPSQGSASITSREAPSIPGQGSTSKPSQGSASIPSRETPSSPSQTRISEPSQGGTGIPSRTSQGSTGEPSQGSAGSPSREIPSRTSQEKPSVPSKTSQEEPSVPSQDLPDMPSREAPSINPSEGSKGPSNTEPSQNEPEKRFTITYKKNTKKIVSGFGKDKNTYKQGSIFTVKAAPSCSSLFFAGWNTKADGSGEKIVPKARIMIQKDMTLYAQWKTTYTASKLKYRVNGKNTVVCIGGKDDRKDSIKIPSTLTYSGIKYKVTEVGTKAFYKNKRLKSVTIGDSVAYIRSKAFYKCKNLRKVTMGKGLTKIESCAFGYNKKGCTIKIKSTKLKAVNGAQNKGTKQLRLQVPTSKKTAYKKLFQETRKKGAKIS